MQVSKHQIPAFNDEDSGLIATAHAGSYPSEVVLAPWEELAARGVVELIEQQAALIEVLSENLVTIATIRKYVAAQFAETLLVASGMRAFLFDDNTIRMNWF